MNINLRTTTDPQIAAEFIAEKIVSQLEKGKKVLWLVPGGSAISVSVKAAKIISSYKYTYMNTYKNLTVTLTDERYGEVGHKNSNWQQMQDLGFGLPQAKLLPVLNGNSLAMTAEKFNTIIKNEFKKADYRIGLFGIGKDSHTAGILPESSAINSKEWVESYQTPQFERITITPKVIEKLNEAVIWVQGKEKWEAVSNLQKNIDIEKAPVQALKKVPKLTIFTDYKN